MKRQTHMSNVLAAVLLILGAVLIVGFIILAMRG
jgi:hypothetical protein